MTTARVTRSLGDFAERARRQQPAQRARSRRHGAVEVDATHRALLEFDDAASLQKLGGNLTHARLVSDKHDAAIALRKFRNRLHDGRKPAAWRECVEMFGAWLTVQSSDQQFRRLL